MARRIGWSLLVVILIVLTSIFLKPRLDKPAERVQNDTAQFRPATDRMVTGALRLTANELGYPVIEQFSVRFGESGTHTSNRRVFVGRSGRIWRACIYLTMESPPESLRSISRRKRGRWQNAHEHHPVLPPHRRVHDHVC